MTEQEKIEIGLCACKGCENSFYDGELCFAEDCHCGEILDRLTKAGYRKEEVVARETAQKIWDSLFMGATISECWCWNKGKYGIDGFDCTEEIYEVFKKFGAEVDK